MDVRDRVGDTAGNRSTFATTFGADLAKRVAVILTFSATIPLGLAVGGRVSKLAGLNIAGAVVSAGLILYLVLRSAIATVPHVKDDQKYISHYVRCSRIAMCIVPICLIFLWRN